MRKLLFIISVCLLVPALALAVPPQSSPESKGEHAMGAREKRWLHSLPEDRQAPARTILQEALPDIARLRHALREKVDALADLNYDESTPPETLLQLGRELQEVRNALRERLVRLEQDLRETVGTVPASLHRHGQRVRRRDTQGLVDTPAEVDKN